MGGLIGGDDNYDEEEDVDMGGLFGGDDDYGDDDDFGGGYSAPASKKAVKGAVFATKEECKQEEKEDMDMGAVFGGDDYYDEEG